MSFEVFEEIKCIPVQLTVEFVKKNGEWVGVAITQHEEEVFTSTFSGIEPNSVYLQLMNQMRDTYLYEKHIQ